MNNELCQKIKVHCPTSGFKLTLPVWMMKELANWPKNVDVQGNPPLTNARSWATLLVGTRWVIEQETVSCPM